MNVENELQAKQAYMHEQNRPDCCLNSTKFYSKKMEEKLALMTVTTFLIIYSRYTNCYIYHSNTH